MTVLLYGSIIPQRDQVVQRNQGETGSRSPLLSLGFKSRVSILVWDESKETFESVAKWLDSIVYEI